MKNLLYIGNKLSCHGYTITTIESLGLLLENENYKLRYASDKKIKFFRLLDMLGATIRHASSTDYVIIDTYGTQNFWYAFLVSQLCRVMHLKYIPILHGGNLPQRLENNGAICKMIFKNAHINVAPSPYFYSLFRHHGFENLVSIPNIIETHNYKFKLREVIRPRLLWVRSLALTYNPSMAIRVLAEVKKDFPEATLCMVGPDKEGLLPNLQALARELQVEVTFTGHLSKTDWISLSEQFDIFINTTHLDNTPVSVIEAMVLGLPVISTNVGGIPFLLKHNETALLVGDDDAVEMAQAVRTLIDDVPLSKAIAVNARQYALGFDWHNVKHKWFEILT